MEKVKKKEKKKKKFLQSNMFKPQYSSFVLPLPDSGGIWGSCSRVLWYGDSGGAGTGMLLGGSTDQIFSQGALDFAKWSQIFRGQF